MIFQYVNALAGAGKTTAAIKYALEQAQQGAKIALVQPSVNLIDQTYTDLAVRNATGVLITKLHSQNVSGAVKQLVMEHLRDCPQGRGEIILLTHQTFFNLPYWHNAESWDVIVDEIPQIHAEWVRKLPENFSSLTDHISVGDEQDGYAPIAIKQGSEAHIQKYAECQYSDAQEEIYQDVCAKLHASQQWETLIHVKSLLATMAGTNKSTNTLHTHSLLRPEPFQAYRSMTFMGAMFTESVLYKVWSNKVAFEPHQEITESLNCSCHVNGSLLIIRYLFDANWSKAFGKSAVRGQTVISLAKDVVQAQMEGRDFIYAANRDDVNGLRSGIRLSTQSHGINDYRHINNAVFMSALNANGPSFNFMKANQVSPEEVTEAQYLQTLYQFVMRTSLRLPHDKSHKTVVVMDKRSADYLAHYFPGCSVEAIENLEVPAPKKRGRPFAAERKTAAQRVAEYRARKRAKLGSPIGDALL